MATKLDIWNKALLFLGQSALTSEADNEERRFILERAWPLVIDDALARGDWRFATKTVELAEDEAATASPGFFAVFPLPSDWVRTIAISFTELFDEYSYDFDRGYQEYILEGQAYHSKESSFFLRYISRDYLTDDNVQNYPPTYVEYLASQLAYVTCDLITQSTTLRQLLERETDNRLRKAKSNDARNVKETQIRPGKWIKSRLSGGRFGRGGPSDLPGAIQTQRGKG